MSEPIITITRFLVYTGTQEEIIKNLNQRAVRGKNYSKPSIEEFFVPSPESAAIVGLSKKPAQDAVKALTLRIDELFKQRSALLDALAQHHD